MSLILFLSACAAATASNNNAVRAEAATPAPTLADLPTQPTMAHVEDRSEQSGESVWPPATYTAGPLQPTAVTALPTLAPTPAPVIPYPSLTLDPYASLSISELANRKYGGGQLQIADTMETNEYFTRYAINYPSDGLTIHGFMSVPTEGSRFPVVIMLHGYVDPAQYQTLDYTTRYADHLAEAGYLVIHPNMRGFPPSDEGPDGFRVGLAIDVLNLVAIIREQSQDPTGYLRRADTEDINLWGHSMGGGVALRVITVNNAPYLRSAVLYGAMSGDETRNYQKILQWSDGEVGEFELAAPAGILEAVSPIYHLERVQAPVSLHHGTEDNVVPPEWSNDLCLRLQLLSRPVECFTYEAMPHTFRGSSDQLFMERAAAFFDRY